MLNASILIVVVLSLGGAAAYALRVRSDLHATRRALTTSRAKRAALTTAQHTASDEQVDALVALADAHTRLDADTATRDKLRSDGRTTYAKLEATLQTLLTHQSDLAEGTRRAQLLDECVVGASQVLNEVSVGDVAHLEATLPAVEKICREATA